MTKRMCAACPHPSPGVSLRSIIRHIYFSFLSFDSGCEFVFLIPVRYV